MKVAAITIIALALAAPAALGSSVSTWRVVKSKSVRGQFAATAISATIKHPKGIAVRFTGPGASGLAAWGCSKGISVSSWSHHYGKGFHALGHVRGKDSCNVTASIGGGPGRLTVQILKRR
jgi:hypothetical protein